MRSGEHWCFFLSPNIFSFCMFVSCISIGYPLFLYIWMHFFHASDMTVLPIHLRSSFFFKWQAYNRSTIRGTVVFLSFLLSSNMLLLIKNLLSISKSCLTVRRSFSKKSKTPFFGYFFSDHHIFFFLGRKMLLCFSNKREDNEKKMASIKAWNSQNVVFFVRVIEEMEIKKGDWIMRERKIFGIN